MIMKKYFVLLGLIFWTVAAHAQEKSVRYVFVDGDCKKGFELHSDVDKKHVLTEVKLVEFDDASSILFAEEEIKGQFLSQIRELYPSSANQFKGIYVYMLNSLKEAEQKKEDLESKYEEEGVMILELRF
jgi:hypothetical protein